MYEHDDKEGEERLIPARKPLFMLNNLFKVAVHLKGRIQALTAQMGNKASLRQSIDPSRASRDKNQYSNVSIQSLAGLFDTIDRR
jgi:hypothetical protein